jgi:hypothetical protein
MPLVRSDPSLVVSASSWTIARYSLPPVYTTHNTYRCQQRTKANTQAIESLAPRVKALAESLREPVSKDDIREESRRNVLER